MCQSELLANINQTIYPQKGSEGEEYKILRKVFIFMNILYSGYTFLHSMFSLNVILFRSPIKQMNTYFTPPTLAIYLFFNMGVAAVN